MVLADGQPVAHRVIAVRFTGRNAQAVKGLSVGSGVVVYVASVRASAKVVSVAVEPGERESGGMGSSAKDDDDGGFGFGFDDEDDGAMSGKAEPTASVVVFQFIATREFVEADAKVLVLPGGGPGLYGGSERGEKGIAALDGFVGRVTQGY
jgi:hypothetical protein